MATVVFNPIAETALTETALTETAYYIIFDCINPKKANQALTQRCLFSVVTENHRIHASEVV